MQPAARKWDLISKVSVFFWALIVIFLAGYLLIANPGKVFAGDPPPSNGQPNGMNGKGYAFDPYVIKTCQNLQDININPRGFYYILGNDIDCSETTSWNGGNGFLPIGASLNGYRFEGSHLDGKGHTISNIFMKCQVMPNDWDNEFGLFTYVGSNSSFSNFKIIGAQYEAVNCNGNNSEYYVGGIYGRGEAVIADVSFEGSITRSCDAQSTNNVGGLVGYGNYQNSIQRSHSTGTIDIYGTGCSGKFSAGGIIGSAYDPSIIDSYSTTDITSGVQFAEPCYYGSGLCQVIGGLIGENYTYDPLFTIQNSYAAGSISLTQTPYMNLNYAVGGLTGNTSSNIPTRYQNVFSATTISLPPVCDDNTCGDRLRVAGAIDGYTSSYDVEDYSTTYFDQTVAGLNNCDDDIGDDAPTCNAINTDGLDGNYFKNNSTNALFSSNWDFNNVWQTTSGYPELRSVANQYPGTVQISSTEILSSTSIRINGSLPAESGSGPFDTSYVERAIDVRVKIGDSSDWLVPMELEGDLSQITISSLPVGKDVTVRLTARNKDGYWGQYSEVITQTAQPGFALIRNCLELQNIKNDLTANYELAKDIDCTETSSWNNGEGFRPIGLIYDNGDCYINSASDAFMGILDGNNYSISNLYINITDGCEVAGLLGAAYQSRIQDLTLKQPTVINNDYLPEGWDESRQKIAASIIGINYGSTITNVHVQDATISANATAGGIVGTMYDYYVTEDMEFSKNSFQGLLYTVKTQNPDGPMGFAGLIGGIQSMSDKGIDIHDNYADVVIDTMDSKGTQTSFGGAIGVIYKAGGNGNIIVRNTYATGLISPDSPDPGQESFRFIGGLVGGMAGFSESNKPRIMDSFSHSTLDLSNAVGYLASGLVSTMDVPQYGFYSGEVINSYFDADQAGTSDCSSVPAAGLDCTAILGQSNYFYNNTTTAPLDTWDFTNIWQTTSTLPVFKTSVYHTSTPIPEARLKAKGGKGSTGTTPTLPTPEQQKKISDAFRNFGGPTDTSSRPINPSLLEQITNKVKDIIRNLPEPVVRSFPFVLMGCTSSGIIFMVLEAQRQAKRLSTLKALITKQRSLAQQRDTFWHLAANYLRAPVTLLMGGVELLTLGVPTAKSLGAAVAKNVTISTVPSATVSKLTNLVKGMQTKVAAIMEDIESSDTLKGIAWPKETPLHVLRTLGFWAPMILLTSLLVLANYIIVGFRKFDINTQTYLTEAVLFGLVAYALYWAFGRLWGVKQKVKTAEQLLARQSKALQAARSDLMIKTVQTLDDDIDQLQGAILNLPADSPAIHPLQEGSTRLRRMVDSFQLLGAAESNRLDSLSPAGSCSNVDAVLKQVIADEQLALGPSGVKLDAPELTDFTVTGAPKLTEQVIGTVLDNAVAFSPQGGEVSIEILSKPGMKGLAIHDNGQGVSKDQLAHMFEPFTKADGDDALRMNHEGLGIDLYLNKLIMQYLGGEI